MIKIPDDVTLMTMTINGRSFTVDPAMSMHEGDEIEVIYDFDKSGGSGSLRNLTQGSLQHFLLTAPEASE